MGKLLLIKNARTTVDPTRPSSQWSLSSDGIASCAALATALEPYELGALFSSTEPKATQTAQHLAERLGLSAAAVPGLEEHHRESVRHLATRDFLASMAQVFRQPDRRILGEESASEALQRFSTAVDLLIHSHGGGNIGIVTQGTVIALYAARYNDIDAYQLWRNMALPSFVVLSIETREILERTLSL